MIWSRVKIIVSRNPTFNGITIHDWVMHNIEYRESRLKRLSAVVPTEKLHLVQGLEFQYFSDLERMLKLEHDLRIIQGTEEVISIGKLLQGVKTIKVTPPFQPSLARSKDGATC